MKLYQLAHVPWLDSQLLYHALPRLNMEGLFLLAPAEPYVCIGCHQDVDQDIDLAYCRANGIPVFRREVGGGGVFLDGHQLFYQLVLHRDNPLARGSKEDFYRRLLEPVVQTYGDLGVPARYKPVNDIITLEGRKISGNGAAEIADHLILVGNIIIDFDYETMVRVLRVPDEKFRDKVYQTMRENLSTLKRETGATPTLEAVMPLLARRFEEALGALEPAPLPQAVYAKAREIQPALTGDEWFYKRGKRVPDRDVKIAAGVNVIQRLHKAPGGLVRAVFGLKDGQLGDVSLSGDFFFYPAEKLPVLELALKGASLDEVAARIADFYQAEGIEAPGLTPADLAQAFSA
ncbi:MAG: lipoate--protein ligase family protein [Chloroflexota bacterium]